MFCLTDFSCLEFKIEMSHVSVLQHNKQMHCYVGLKFHKPGNRIRINESKQIVCFWICVFTHTANKALHELSPIRSALRKALENTHAVFGMLKPRSNVDYALCHRVDGLLAEILHEKMHFQSVSKRQHTWNQLKNNICFNAGR